MIRIEREFRNGLSGSRARFATLQELRFGGHGSSGCGSFADAARSVGVDVIALVAGRIGARALRRQAIEGLAGVGAGEAVRSLIVGIVLPGAGSRGRAEVIAAVVLSKAAGPLTPDALAICVAGSPLPDDVLVLIRIDGDVVVHGVVVLEGAAPAGEDAGVEDVHEGLGLRGHRVGAGEELAGGELAAVHFFVGIPALDQYAPFEGDTCKETLGLAVGEDARNAFEGCGAGRFGVAADGTCSERDVAAERDAAELCKGLDGHGIVEDEDEVGQLEADLAAEAAADGAYCAGCRPVARCMSCPFPSRALRRWMILPTAIREPRNDNTTPKPSTSQEASLENGQDGQALRIGEDGRRDDFVGAEGLFGIDEGGEDTSGLLALACMHTVQSAFLRILVAVMAGYFGNRQRTYSAWRMGEDC